MAKRVINLTTILKNIPSGWVAITPDYKKVVAKGRDFRTVNKKVGNLPSGSVVLMPMVKTPRYVVPVVVE